MAEQTGAVARTPVARSPITPAPPETVARGWSVSGRRSDSALTLTDCTPLAKVRVKAAWDGSAARSLGIPFGRAARRTWSLGSDVAVLLVGSAPGEWLALGPPGSSPLVVEHLRRAALLEPAELVTVIDVTHGRALLRLSGPRSVDVLAQECGVDLSDDICPDGAALSCPVAGVSTEVVRDDRDGPSYLLHCEWSAGRYLFDALLDAGTDHGIDVDGFRTRGDPG